MIRRVKEDLGEYRALLRAPGLGVWRWDKKLPLASRPGVLRVGFWGCGSAFAQNQFQSNMVIIKGKTVVFVDLGSKTTVKMAEFGISVADVPNLIVSHSHADHVGSVEELGLKGRYEAPIRVALAEGLKPGPDGKLLKRAEEIRKSGITRIPLWAPPDYAKELWTQTLRGGMAHSEEVDLGGPKGLMDLSHFFDLRKVTKVPAGRFDRDAWEFTIGEGKDRIAFLMYVVPHIPDNATALNDHFFSAGLVIDGRVMISGDTRNDPTVYEGPAKNCETLFSDCQSFTGGVHVSYDELKRLPADVKKKMLLYHCDDGMRPLGPDGKLSDRDVTKDGFAGFTEPIPTFYEWD